MTNEKDRTRRFSLEDIFMNYSTDDLLYGAMYHLATYHPKKEKLYLSRNKFNINKKYFYTFIKGKSQAKNLKNHLTKLIERGLVVEEEIGYTFPQDYYDNYQIIDWNMLYYVVDTRSPNAVRIYVYLLNKYLWKKEQEEYYSFTNREIMDALGYKTEHINGRISGMITNILESLAREGIIKWVEYYESTIDNIPTPRKKLTFVAERKEQLRKIED